MWVEAVQSLVLLALHGLLRDNTESPLIGAISRQSYNSDLLLVRRAVRLPWFSRALNITTNLIGRRTDSKSGALDRKV